MAKFSEMSFGAQLGVILVVAALVTGGAYYLLYKDMRAANADLEQQVMKIEAENAQLQQYVAKKPELEAQIASLEQQLEIQKRIVPDEKEADKFMHLMQDTAAEAGILIRRYTARPMSRKEFYAEVPFDIELDGSFYGVLNFFERVGKLERIINIGSLTMASVDQPRNAKVKATYDYTPTETVVASAVATTFFSHEGEPDQPPAAPGARPGARPGTPAVRR